jgi:predicted transcriptional regulator of viral defense system
MNITNTTKRGISEKNRKILTILHRETTGPFTPQEVVNISGLDISRTRRLLARLAEAGWLSRIRPGLYTTVTLDVEHPASWQEDPWIIANKTFSPSYIGGWSACEHWGLTDQIFKETIVITSRPKRRNQITIQGIPFYVKTVRQDRLFGTDVVWRKQTRILVSDPSKTIVDMLNDPKIGGGIRHIFETLKTYLSHERRNDSELIDYAHRYGNKTVFKRLGYLLEVTGLDNTELITECRKAISPGISLLDPDAPEKGKFVRRWNLRLNVALDGESY